MALFSKKIEMYPRTRISNTSSYTLERCIADTSTRPSSTQLLNDLYYIEFGYGCAPTEIKEDLANWNVYVNGE